MKQLFILSLISIMMASSIGYAKRISPKKVAPVKSGDIEYRAPMSAQRIGTVEAWDTKTKKLLWTQKVYTLKYNENLERDVQWVFIKSMKLKEDTLIISNERGIVYHLDVKTKKVVKQGKKL